MRPGSSVEETVVTAQAGAADGRRNVEANIAVADAIAADEIVEFC